MIPYEFYYWGPLLTKTQVSDDIIRMLAEEGDKLTIEEHDFSKSLAGEIKEEKKYTEDVTREISKLLRPNFDNWFDVLKTQWKPGYSNLKYYFKLKSLWINYQRKGESNPIHSHNGDLSFVIYVDIPEEISKEKSRTSNSTKPGSIIFENTPHSYHLDDDNYRKALSPIHQVIHEPKSGEMFIFPATLRHYVLPFYSDVIRKSVSGNLVLRRY